jgi:hypothetical protein
MIEVNTAKGKPGLRNDGLRDEKGASAELNHARGLKQ